MCHHVAPLTLSNLQAGLPGEAMSCWWDVSLTQPGSSGPASSSEAEGKELAMAMDHVTGPSELVAKPGL